MARISKKALDAQSTWEERIRRAKEVRTKWKERFKVDLAREFFEGVQNPGMPRDEWIVINKVYSHVKAQVPALYPQDPYFYVKLRKSYSPNPTDIALWDMKGKMRSAMLNYLKSELGLKEKVKLAIYDSFFAYGVVKVHFTADVMDNPDAGKYLTGEAGEFLLDETGKGFLMEPETLPANEAYKLTRIHPDDFLWDEDAGTLKDSWHWVAQRIRMTIDEVKADPRFSKAAIKALEGKGSELSEEDKTRETRKKGDDIASRGDDNWNKYHPKEAKDEIVTIWEIYDLKAKTWCVIAENGETPLLYDEPLPVGIDCHPFVILGFTPRDDSPYPIPPMSQGIDAQKEYNNLRSKIMTHLKRFNRKYVASLSAFGENAEGELSKLESGEDGTVIISQVGDVRGAVAPIQDAALDQQHWMMLSALNQDMIELFGGSSDESRGIAGADSATQAGILEKRLAIKEGDARAEVADFVKQIGRKLDQLVQAHITRDEAVKITGPEGELWEMVRQTDYEEIDGEYEYNVNVGATMPQLPQMERASWMAFMQFLANAPQFLTSKRLLKRVADMHHIEDEPMIEELFNMGRKMAAGQMQAPGKQGSLPGQSEVRPVSAVGGQAGGNLAWNKPGAGNLEG